MASETKTGTTVPHDAHASPGFPPFDASTFPSQLLWLAITFGLFYYLMSKVALPQIASILEVRKDRIAGDLAEADRLKGESEAAIAAYEQALAEARQNAHAIAQSNREKLQAEIEAKRHKSEERLAAKVAEAEARIGEITKEALSHVSEIAEGTASEIVNKLVGARPQKADVANAVAARLKE